MKESILQELAGKIRVKINECDDDDSIVFLEEEFVVRPYLFFVSGRVNYYDEIEPSTFTDPGYFERIIIYADLHITKNALDFATEEDQAMSEKDLKTVKSFLR